MKLNVPPTKSNGLTLSRDLSFAIEGHNLLDQKRHILTLELMQYVDAAKRDQAEADEHLATAHAALREAGARVGSQQLAREAMAVPVAKSVRISERRVMGLAVPATQAEQPPVVATFGFAGGTVKADEAMAAFAKALEAITRLAETQNAVFRLARQTRKTQRRVNALDKVFIPNYRETVDFITATLDQRDQEAAVMVRLVRDRLRERAARRRTGGE